MEQEHKRRPRYKGTHPRTFQEKYKEHDPEKYRSEVEKILERGKTPAGMHIPIMVDEILDVLQIRPGQTGYDATLGYGGHTRKLLEQLQGQGHLYATDVDPIEMEKTRARLAAAGYRPYYLYRQKYMSGSLENVGWAKPGTESLYNIVMMEELQTVVSIGGGGVTKLVDPAAGRILRLPNPKYPHDYLAARDKILSQKDEIVSFYGG